MSNIKVCLQVLGSTTAFVEKSCITPVVAPENNSVKSDKLS